MSMKKTLLMTIVSPSATGGIFPYIVDKLQIFDTNLGKNLNKSLFM